MKLRFVSRNEHKINEVQEILGDIGIEIIPVKHSINEIQTEDVEDLVRDKLLKAFDIVGREVFVEHTGLYVASLDGFPGGLTQVFWDKLQADKFSSLLGCGEDIGVVAKTIIGYCNSRKVYIFEGCVNGTISEQPKGNRDFQWDCIFIPEGESKTFAELGKRKNDISMRKIAFDKFRTFLAEEQGNG